MSISHWYNDQIIISAISDALSEFYEKLIGKIDSLNISTVMKSKNPYLYRAKAMQNASEIVESVLNAYISSSEETIFGNCFFEPLAIAACNGVKSITPGVDIEVRDETTLHAIAVKSGTKIFNAASKDRQRQYFAAASRLAQQGRLSFDAIIGYAYGKKTSETPRGEIYRELAGKRFWAELTGDDDFYLKIIKYMDTLPEQYVEEYKKSYNRASNRLVRDFSSLFCNYDGSIDWERLVKFNSGD